MARIGRVYRLDRAILPGMLHSHDRYTLRPAAPEDLVAVAELLAAADRAEHGETSLGEAFLRGEWGRPRFVHVTDTAVVTTHEGTIVGYGEAFDEALPDVIEGMGVVHPGHRGRGIGATLIRAQERRAREQLRRIRAKRVTLRTVVPGKNAAAARLVAARGFQLVRTFFHMEADLADPTKPDAPPGIDGRAFDPDRDERLLYVLLQEAFRGHWGYAEQPFDEWTRTQAAAGLDPDLCFFATVGDEAVGAVVATELEDHGWINELAVLPAHRHRGIGTFLLQRAFAALARRGQRRVLLNVDAENPTGALGVYERAGMRVRRRWDLHEKEIA
jgi:mycothiol synthase